MMKFVIVAAISALAVSCAHKPKEEAAPVAPPAEVQELHREADAANTMDEKSAPAEDKSAKKAKKKKSTKKQKAKKA